VGGGETEEAFTGGRIFGFPDYLPRPSSRRCFEHDEQRFPVTSFLVLSRLRSFGACSRPVSLANPLSCRSTFMFERRSFNNFLTLAAAATGTFLLR
jgi:hypothetical protein